MNEITFKEIKNFTIKELSLSNNTLVTEDTCLVNELGVAGDDGLDYIEAFSKEFKTSFEGFNSINYFGYEKSANIFNLFNYIYDKFIKKKPEKNLIDLPRIPLGHLLRCANLGKWTEPQT